MLKREGEVAEAAEVVAEAVVEAAEAVVEVVARRFQEAVEEAAAEAKAEGAVEAVAAKVVAVEVVSPEVVQPAAAVSAGAEAVPPAVVLPGVAALAEVAVHVRANADRHPHPEGILKRIDPACSLKGALRHKTEVRPDRPINEVTIRKIAKILPRTGNRTANPSKIPIVKIGSNTAKISKRIGRTLPPTMMTTIMGGIMEITLWRQEWWRVRP